jgi:hypothetical protein
MSDIGKYSKDEPYAQQLHTSKLAAKVQDRARAMGRYLPEALFGGRGRSNAGKGGRSKVRGRSNVGKGGRSVRKYPSSSTSFSPRKVVRKARR